MYEIEPMVFRVFLFCTFFLMCFSCDFCIANDENTQPFVMEKVNVSHSVGRSVFEKKITSDFIFDDFFLHYNYDKVLYGKIDEKMHSKKFDHSNENGQHNIQYKNNYVSYNENKVLLTNNYGKSVTMTCNNCNEIWHTKLAHFISAKPLLNEKFAVVATIGAIYVLNIEDGAIFWQYDIVKLGKTAFHHHPIFLSEDLLFFIDTRGKMLIVNLENKKILHESYYVSENCKNCYFFNDPIIFNEDIVVSTTNDINIFDKELTKLSSLKIKKSKIINKIDAINGQLFVLTDQNKISVFDLNHQPLYEIANDNISDFFIMQDFLILCKNNAVEIFSLAEKKVVQILKIKRIDVKKMHRNELQLYDAKNKNIYIIKQAE